DHPWHRGKPPRRLVQPRAPGGGARAGAGGDGDPRVGRPARRSPLRRRPGQRRAPPGRGRGAEARHRRGGRAADRDAGVQLQHPGRPQERDRLGVAAGLQVRAGGEARRHHGHKRRRGGHGARPDPPARGDVLHPRPGDAAPRRAGGRSRRQVHRRPPHRRAHARVPGEFPGHVRRLRGPAAAVL
ncbi:MAG: NADPH:quinone oxidoreductase, partial [uncultured Gemmatimonadetes bacterium]